MLQLCICNSLGPFSFYPRDCEYHSFCVSVLDVLLNERLEDCGSIVLETKQLIPGCSCPHFCAWTPLGDSEVAPANQTKGSGVRELAGKESRTDGQTRKDPAFQGSARLSFSKFRALGSAISRVRQDTFAEKVKFWQENITAPWGSARSTLSEFLAFRKIILLNLLRGVILRFLNRVCEPFQAWKCCCNKRFAKQVPDSFPQKFGNPTSFGLVCLSDPTDITPPYRETGVAIPLSDCVSTGIADYRCYTPASFLKNGLSRPKDRPIKGGIAERACL